MLTRKRHGFDGTQQIKIAIRPVKPMATDTIAIQHRLDRLGKGQAAVVSWPHWRLQWVSNPSYGKLLVLEGKAVGGRVPRLVAAQRSEGRHRSRSWRGRIAVNLGSGHG